MIHYITVIAGLEVESEHCTLENNNSCVTLIPTEGALCAVNGNLVTESTKLTQGNINTHLFTVDWVLLSSLSFVGEEKFEFKKKSGIFFNVLSGSTSLS